MTDKKEIFLNKDLRTGGFYELCIQVCPSSDNDPIKLYNDFLWSLDNVEGPYKSDFNKTTVNIENYEHEGILKLDKYFIPFKTFHIREESPIETGFNWFDISIYTSSIETIFGKEYNTWTENPNPPKAIIDFFHWTMKELYKVYAFKLAFIDFEISGQYYLDDLKGKIENWTKTRFYVGQENIKLVADENKEVVTVIE